MTPDYARPTVRSPHDLYVREWRPSATTDIGRVALLVHGLSSSHRTWNALGPALAEQGFRVLAPDLRGHGGSERAAYSRELFADDLLALVDSLGATVDLTVSHSLGGVVAAMLAEHLQPDRTVYLDPAWYPWTPAEGYAASQAFFRTLPDATATDLSDQNPRWSAEAVADRLAEIAEWDPATSTMRYLETAAVPVYAVRPSLVLAAEAGGSVLADPVVAHLREVGFEVDRVPGTGHFVHLDAPDDVVDRVRAYAAAPGPVRNGSTASTN